jgi:hypothetical protein
VVLVLVDLDVENGGAPIHMEVEASPRAGVGVIVRAHWLSQGEAARDRLEGYAAPIEDSGVGESFNQRLVRFIRDPVIVCGPNRRFQCGAFGHTAFTQLVRYRLP